MKQNSAPGTDHERHSGKEGVKYRKPVILTNDQIADAVTNGDIQIQPFSLGQVQGATYDLRVGEEAATTASKRKLNVKDLGFFVIQPGEFATVLTLEELRLSSSFVGRFGLRSKLSRKGLVSAIGPQIDPGYHGRLTIALANLSPRPISLSYGEDLVSVEFHQLHVPSSKPYDGPYQDRLSLGPEEIETIAETEGLAFSEVVTTLRSLSANAGNLTTDVSKLTSDVTGLTSNVQQLTADVRTLTTRIAELAGQLAGSRWLMPMLIGMIMGLLGMIIGIVVRR
jgi:dCTP deaminase